LEDVLNYNESKT